MMLLLLLAMLSTTTAPTAYEDLHQTLKAASKTADWKEMLRSGTGAKEGAYDTGKVAKIYHHPLEAFVKTTPTAYFDNSGTCSIVLGCDPRGDRPCCSPFGFCGNTNEHCICPLTKVDDNTPPRACIDYSKNVTSVFPKGYVSSWLSGAGNDLPIRLFWKFSRLQVVLNFSFTSVTEASAPLLFEIEGSADADCHNSSKANWIKIYKGSTKPTGTFHLGHLMLAYCMGFLIEKTKSGKASMENVNMWYVDFPVDRLRQLLTNRPTPPLTQTATVTTSPMPPPHRQDNDRTSYNAKTTNTSSTVTHMDKSTTAPVTQNAKTTTTPPPAIRNNWENPDLPVNEKWTTPVPGSTWIPIAVVGTLITMAIFLYIFLSGNSVCFKKVECGHLCCSCCKKKIKWGVTYNRLDARIKEKTATKKDSAKSKSVNRSQQPNCHLFNDVSPVASEESFADLQEEDYNSSGNDCGSPYHVVQADIHSEKAEHIHPPSGPLGGPCLHAHQSPPRQAKENCTCSGVYYSHADRFFSSFSTIDAASVYSVPPDSNFMVPALPHHSDIPGFHLCESCSVRYKSACSSINVAPSSSSMDDYRYTRRSHLIRFTGVCETCTGEADERVKCHGIQKQ